MLESCKYYNGKKRKSAWTLWDKLCKNTPRSLWNRNEFLQALNYSPSQNYVSVSATCSINWKRKMTFFSPFSTRMFMIGLERAEDSSGTTTMNEWIIKACSGDVGLLRVMRFTFWMWSLLCVERWCWTCDEGRRAWQQQGLDVATCYSGTGGFMRRLSSPLIISLIDRRPLDVVQAAVEGQCRYSRLAYLPLYRDLSATSCSLSFNRGCVVSLHVATLGTGLFPFFKKTSSFFLSVFLPLMNWGRQGQELSICD